MKNPKNSKYKNVGVLFELLTRQITIDILNNKESKALAISQEFFGKKTQLRKELMLYNTLINEELKIVSSAEQLVTELTKVYKKLDKGALRREKYNLIKEIKQHYNLNEFFKLRIVNY